MRENPNKVPPNFFENQKADILSAVSKSHKKSSSIIPMRTVRIFSIAASLALFALVLSTWITDSETPCISYSCLLESIEFDDLSESDELLIEEWEDEEFEEEFGIYIF